jgi:type I restriction enzyme, S subunit
MTLRDLLPRRPSHREIGLLREYRTRLITDVVTGKLDVRGAAAKLPDEAAKPILSDEEAEMPAEGLDAEDEEMEAVEVEAGP